MQLYVKGFLAAIQGVPVTLGVTLASIIIGVLLGLVLALMKMSKSKALSVISGVYVEVVRGTPLVVQALILAYGLPQLLQSKGVDFKWPYLVIPAIIVCGLNSAAYVAEVIRSGIQAVDKGQMEAARSLGMTHRKAMRLIVIPQALKIVLPSSVPLILSVMKVNIGLCLVGVIIGEFIGARKGLGYLIIYGSQTFRLTWVLMSIVILCIIAMLLYFALYLIEKQVRKH